MQRQNLSPSVLAERAGISASTLTRFLAAAESDERQSYLSATTIEKLCRHYRVKPPGVQQGFDDGDAAPWREVDPRDAVARLSTRPATDIWRVSTPALESAGYRVGDLLLVDLNAEPRAGDVVIAQRYDFDAGRAETILRIFEPPFLVAASNEPALRKPLMVDGAGAVVIKGVVLASYRLRHAA
ncbi:MAG: hypothetical protein K2Q06_02945 [Parvularculaceae bacterium]|nr:hypothetical protein [Parvularculaceae bacterium]